MAYDSNNTKERKQMSLKKIISRCLLIAPMMLMHDGIAIETESNKTSRMLQIRQDVHQYDENADTTLYPILQPIYGGALIVLSSLIPLTYSPEIKPINYKVFCLIASIGMGLITWETITSLYTIKLSGLTRALHAKALVGGSMLLVFCVMGCGAAYDQSRIH